VDGLQRGIFRRADKFKFEDALEVVSTAERGKAGRHGKTMMNENRRKDE
jgi:hypothetical protein